MSDRPSANEFNEQISNVSTCYCSAPTSTAFNGSFSNEVTLHHFNLLNKPCLGLLVVPIAVNVS